MGSRVFLDVDIGDPIVHAHQQAEFEETLRFFEQNRAQLGLPADAALESIDADGRDLLTEAFQTRDASGEPRLEVPPPLCAGRLVIELCSEAPKAVEKFRCLCTGERGKGKKSGKPLHYQGASFHRIVKGFVCQGGDIIKGDGSGGDSIYSGSFKQEKAGLKLRHDAAGVVSMASSNESQFFITLALSAAM